MSVITDKNKIERLLQRRVSEDGFFPSRDEVIKELLSGKKLSFYYGIDPTGSDIHLGHVVQLLLLKGLAELGHEIVVLIGDFTAQVGDPTGKDKTRKNLTEKEVKENMNTYLDQISRIIPQELFKVRHNSEWLSKMNFKDILELTSKVTVQQMIQRDMFQERIKGDKPISLNEFLYPLMQGYDSVAMKIDGEIGGHDQIFNMLIGRDLEKRYIGKEKIILATKLLVVLGTGKKMSKSEGEIIAIKDEPNEIRRKVLALDDEFIETIFNICTDIDEEWMNEKKMELKEKTPQAFKELLSDKLIEMFQGKEKVAEANKPKQGKATGNLATTIKDFGFTSSIASAKQLISSNAVEVNGNVETSWDYMPKEGDIIRVGKGKFGEIKN